MTSPLERIRHGATIFVGVLVLSVCGHYLLTRQTWIESLYWFVITVSSVGYTEDSRLDTWLQVYTIVVIVVGMSTGIYTIGGFIQLVAEGEVEKVLGLRRMNRDIRRLKDHVIICGFGRIGQNLVQELSRSKPPLLVIENNTEALTEAIDLDCLALSGDATEESVLIAAGVERAKSLVSGLPSDADNVFITLTARNLNPNLQIIARGEHPNSEKKLFQAGANQVVLAAVIGAQRIARLITKPHTADLIERVIRRDILDAELDELTIRASSPLVGRSVADAETRRKHHLLIVATSDADGKMVFNPDAGHVFSADETIIVMGRTEDIERFCSTFAI